MSTTTIIPPQTYAEWVSILKALKEKNNDQEVLQAMREGTIAWQLGVIDRFSKKLFDVVFFRLDSTMDCFRNKISKAYGREDDIIYSLIILRKEIIFLSKVIEIPALPEEERKANYDWLVKQVNQIQNNLEDFAKEEPSGKMPSIIRNNSVNII